MPIADPTHAHAHKRADARRHAPSRRSALPRCASLFAIASLGALGPFAACVPTPFTFEETGTGGGAGSSTTAGGGEGGSTTSASGGGGGMSSSSSSTGTGVVNPCGPDSACVEAVPPDWEALAIVIVSDEGGQKPPCPLEQQQMPEKLLGGKPMEAHTCGPCSCNVGAVTCSAPQITCWSGDSSCGDGGGAFYNAWTAPNASCLNDQGSSIDDNLPGSCKLTADATPSPSGNCPPAGGNPIKGGWTLDVHVCEPAPPSGMPCGSEGKCTPLNTGEQLCIRKAGVAKCPLGWPVLVESYTGANDERVCSPCTCGPATCTGGAYTAYDGLNCDVTTGNMLVNSTTCVDVPNIIDASAMSLMPQVGMPVASTCSGGEPMGAFIPTGPVTFCCRPQ